MLYYHPVFNHACVAQLAEQLTRNEQVAGSNPATSSKSSTPPGVLLFYPQISPFPNRTAKIPSPQPVYLHIFPSGTPRRNRV